MFGGGLFYNLVLFAAASCGQSLSCVICCWLIGERNNKNNYEANTKGNPREVEDGCEHVPKFARIFLTGSIHSCELSCQKDDTSFFVQERTQDR